MYKESGMKKNNWLRIALWILASIIFVILTAELRDLILFIMIGILLTKAANSSKFF